MKDIISRNDYSLCESFNANFIDDFIAFIDRERSTRTYLTNLRQFVAYLNYKSIIKPVREDIIAFRNYLAEEHEAIIFDKWSGWRYRLDKSGNKIILKCKPATIKIYLQSVSQLFKYLSSRGIYPNIAEGINTPKIDNRVHKKEALTALDVVKIEKSIEENAAIKLERAEASRKDNKRRIERATEQGKRLYAIYLLAVNCGLRTIEISRANIKDLETLNGVTYLYIQGKGHAEADAKKALAPQVAEAIFDYLGSRVDSKRAESPLFVSTGNRSGGKRIATTTISTMLKRAMKEAGYNSERITAHSLRHTAGTSVQEITNDIYITQKYMRHSNPATTEIYLHNDTSKKEIEVAANLYNYYHDREGAKEVYPTFDDSIKKGVNKEVYPVFDESIKKGINKVAAIEDKIKGLTPEQREKVYEYIAAI